MDDKRNPETGPHGPLTTILNDQGRLETPAPGVWEHWGAHAYEIRAGDFIMFRRRDETVIREYEVEEVLPRGDVWDSCGTYFRATSGAEVWVGALQRFVLFREGTHHTLSSYAR